MTPLVVSIAKLREKEGWTIDQLAEKSGVSRSTIIRLEQGHTRQVHLDTLEALAKTFGVAAGLLLEQQRQR